MRPAHVYNCSFLILQGTPQVKAQLPSSATACYALAVSADGKVRAKTRVVVVVVFIQVIYIKGVWSPWVRESLELRTGLHGCSRYLFGKDHQNAVAATRPCSMHKNDFTLNDDKYLHVPRQ